MKSGGAEVRVHHSGTASPVYQVSHAQKEQRVEHEI